MKIEGQPTVVAICINFNQAQYTIDCISSILQSNYENLHIILIDNGSKKEVVDKMLKGLKKSPLLSIECLENNLGYVQGINYGMRLGERHNPDYYLILNNDTLIDSESVFNLVNTAEKYQQKAIISGKVYHYHSKDYLQYIGQNIDPQGGINQIPVVRDLNEKDNGQYDMEMEMGMLDDIYWLIPIGLYKKIGGYSKLFYLYGEQNDYAFRAIKAGYKLVYTPHAKLWHKGGVSTCNGDKSSPKIEYWTTFATLKLATLHMDSDKSQRFIVTWSIRKLLRTILLFLQGKTRLLNIKAVVIAIYHFKCWNVIRYNDNGYNPFS